MNKYSFKAKLKNEMELTPKGFYYQGKYTVLVGCEKTGDTIRRKELTEDVEITIVENTILCSKCGKKEGKGKTNQCDTCLMNGII